MAGRSADNSHNAKGKRGGTGSGRASQQRRGPQHKPARTRGPKGAGSRYGPRPDGEQRGGGQRGTGQRNSGQRNSGQRKSGQRSADQQDYDGPQIADDIRAGDLDRSVRQSLSNVPPKLAERVARHLVAAGRLIGEDPQTALAHARAARARASRNAFVREAVGETAYAAGDYSQALSELRAARRMNGVQAYAAVIADCERALGRPDRATRMDTAQLRAGLNHAERVELAIVVAGARRDMGQIDAGLQRLERENPGANGPGQARLRYAYADMLLAAGRPHESLEWFHKTAAADAHQETDAEERIAEFS